VSLLEQQQSFAPSFAREWSRPTAGNWLTTMSPACGWSVGNTPDAGSLDKQQSSTISKQSPITSSGSAISARLIACAERYMTRSRLCVGTRKSGKPGLNPARGNWWFRGGGGRGRGSRHTWCHTDLLIGVEGIQVLRIWHGAQDRGLNSRYQPRHQNRCDNAHRFNRSSGTGTPPSASARAHSCTP
jgi:hypothetical protein